MSRLLTLILIFAFFSCKNSNNMGVTNYVQEQKTTEYITIKKLAGSAWVFDTPLKEDAYLIRFTETEYIVETEHRGVKSTTRDKYYLSIQPPSYYATPRFDSTKIKKETMGEYMYINVNGKYCIVRHIHNFTPTKLEFIYGDGAIDTFVKVE